MGIIRRPQQWTWFTGVIMMVVLGYNPTAGLAIPTLPQGEGAIHFDLNPGSERDLMPFTAPLQPVIPAQVCQTSAWRAACFFTDSSASSRFWHWETTLYNTSATTSRFNLPISFSVFGINYVAGLLSLSPASTVLFDIVVRDVPEQALQYWIASLSSALAAVPLLSLDTAIREPAVPGLDVSGTYTVAFSTGPDDNFQPLPGPVAGGLDLCIANSPDALCPVPEPSTLLLCGSGLTVLLWTRRHRRRLMVSRNAR